MDDSGNVYVTGDTSSSDFPNKNAVQPVFGGGTDAFVAKLDPTAFGADSLVYSTFLGDGGDDSGNGIAVDSSGAVYVGGDTASANFSLAGGTCQMIGSGGGDGDAFVIKLDAAGSVLTYCTFLGGVELDMATGIAVDGSGAAYIAGLTNSADFPIEGTFGTVFGGKGRFGIGDAFVAKLDADGSALNYSLFLGGSDRDFATGVAVDGSGAAYVVGTTRSDNFPVKDPLPGQGSLNRVNDAFVAKLNPMGSGLVYSTYLGGNQGGGATFGNAISVDSSGAAYVVGETFADDFPTTPDAFQPIFRPASFGRSSSEAFVSKITSAPTGGSVTIDPGHGRQCNRADRRPTGTGPGPTFGDTEDDLVLEIGLRLATTLRAAGHEVTVTRETECLITREQDPRRDREERARIANEAETDIFVSIHLNADGPTAHGMEVWYFPEVEQGPLPPRAERSMSLAELILNRQVALGLRDRGLKLAGVDPPWNNRRVPDVLRLTTMPAVLTEVAFLTNSQLAPDQTITDEELLHDADFRGQVEQAIAAAIAEFFEQ